MDDLIKRSAPPLPRKSLLGIIGDESRLWQADAQRFASAFVYAAIGMALVAPQGTLLQVNNAFCELIGYSREELLSLDFQSITHPEDLQLGIYWKSKLIKGEVESFHIEKRYLHKDGHYIWGLLSASLIRDAKGEPLYLISQIQDITLRKQLESEAEQRQKQNEEIRSLVENATDVIARIDAAYRIAYVNRAITSISGLSPDAYIGKTLTEAGFPESFSQTLEASIGAVFETKCPLSREYWGSDGLHYFHGRFVPEFDASGNVASVLIVARDITDIRRVQDELRETEQRLRAANQELAKVNEKLRRLASHDGLTGLKNRRHFDECLKEALFQAEQHRARGQECEFSLLLIDVDRFKAINDKLGHLVGDEVLHEVAQVLLQTLRPTDVVARYGGEEFGVILYDTGESGSRFAAERCRSAVEKYVQIKCPVTISLGASTWNGEDAQTLVGRADLALYAAKRAGRNGVYHAKDLK